MEIADPDVYKPDATDLAIINLLMEDGRLSAAELAARIGNISERTIRNRLNALIERSLIRVGALPDPTAMGRMVYTDVMIQVEPGKIMDVAKQLVDYDCVNYVACITGENDIAIQVTSPTIADMYEFVTTRVGNLPYVRKTTTTVIPIVLKTFGHKTRDFDRLAEASPTVSAKRKKRTTRSK